MATISLWGNHSPGKGYLKVANASTNHLFSTILILLMIVPCTTNYLSHFVSAQVNKPQNAVLVQQGYTKLHLTMENTYYLPLDGHHYKDSEA